MLYCCEYSLYILGGVIDPLARKKQYFHLKLTNYQ